MYLLCVLVLLYFSLLCCFLSSFSDFILILLTLNFVPYLQRLLLLSKYHTPGSDEEPLLWTPL